MRSKETNTEGWKQKVSALLRGKGTQGAKRIKSWSDEYWRLVQESEKKAGHIICGAKNRRGSPCTKYPMEHSERCKMHGGASTGSKTIDGRVAQVKAKIKTGTRSRYFGTLIKNKNMIQFKNVLEAVRKDPKSLMEEEVAMLTVAQTSMPHPRFIADLSRAKLRYMQALGVTELEDDNDFAKAVAALALLNNLPRSIRAEIEKKVLKK